MRRIKDLVPLAQKGSILERLEVLRLIDRGFPYVFSSAELPKFVPELEALAYELARHAERTVADEGEHLQRQIARYRKAKSI